MVATGRIAVATQIDPSYSQDGVNVHRHLIVVPRAHASLPRPNGITIGSAVFAGLTVVTATLTQTDHATPSEALGRVHASTDMLHANAMRHNTCNTHRSGNRQSTAKK